MDAYRDQYAKLFRNGDGVVLLAISADPPGVLSAWAKERKYPFRFASDQTGEAGRLYGAWRPDLKLDDRRVYVVGPDGRIAYAAVPFREVDPLAYTELGGAVARAASARSAPAR
jgi:peroxiredoxin Q/BCP